MWSVVSKKITVSKRNLKQESYSKTKSKHSKGKKECYLLGQNTTCKFSHYVFVPINSFIFIFYLLCVWITISKFWHTCNLKIQSTGRPAGWPKIDHYIDTFFHASQKASYEKSSFWKTLPHMENCIRQNVCINQQLKKWCCFQNICFVVFQYFIVNVFCINNHHLRTG